MVSIINQADVRALTFLPGSQQLSSGVATGRICSRLVMAVAVAGDVSIRTLDGTTTTLTAVPAGFHQVEVQFDMVTWTGTITAIGLYRV